MSSNVNPVQDSQSTAAAATSAIDTTNTAKASPVNGGETVSTSSKIGSLNDLKEKSPKLYNEMMVGIGTNICKKMEHHQDRLKKLMREARQQR